MTDPMHSQATYRALCESETDIPLFLQAWWLDATCGAESWDVVLVEKGGQVHAALPYRMSRRQGFRVLSQPPLTPFLGPWLRDTGAKTANSYSRQKDLMTELIAQLPAFDHYQQNWSPRITNWLPFYWQGFKQSTRYTYAINELGEENALWGRLRENIRTDIRKARNRFRLTVDADAALDEFLRLNDLVFSRQGRTRPYADAYVSRIDAECSARACRRIFIARDDEGRAHAGVYLVWDKRSAHYLLGGGDPELRNSGATSLCMWEAIRFAATVTKRFDFEGSMIEPIERFFRAFGADQVPYFEVSKTPSRLLAGLMSARTLVRGA